MSEIDNWRKRARAEISKRGKEPAVKKKKTVTNLAGEIVGEVPDDEDEDEEEESAWEKRERFHETLRQAGFSRTYRF